MKYTYFGKGNTVLGDIEKGRGQGVPGNNLKSGKII